MYLRLVDSHKFKSPILYIHSDEEEFLEVIRKWHKELLSFLSEHPEIKGLPLGYFDPNNAIVDLLHTLTNYYVEATPYCHGHVTGTFRLYADDFLAGEEVTELRLEDGAEQLVRIIKE